MSIIYVYLYSLLQPFTTIVGGGGQQYVLLLVALSLSERMYPKRSTYPDTSLNLSSVVHQVC